MHRWIVHNTIYKMNLEKWFLFHADFILNCFPFIQNITWSKEQLWPFEARISSYILYIISSAHTTTLFKLICNQAHLMTVTMETNRTAADQHSISIFPRMQLFVCCRNSMFLSGSLLFCIWNRKHLLVALGVTILRSVIWANL